MQTIFLPYQAPFRSNTRKTCMCAWAALHAAHSDTVKDLANMYIDQILCCVSSEKIHNLCFSSFQVFQDKYVVFLIETSLLTSLWTRRSLGRLVGIQSVGALVDLLYLSQNISLFRVNRIHTLLTWISHLCWLLQRLGYRDFLILPSESLCFLPKFKDIII